VTTSGGRAWSARTDSLDASLSAEDGGLSLAGRLADPRPSQEAHAAGLELKVRIQQALAQLSPNCAGGRLPRPGGYGL